MMGIDLCSRMLVLTVFYCSAWNREDDVFFLLQDLWVCQRRVMYAGSLE